MPMMVQDPASENHLGRAIRRLREAKGWTQVDLAARSKVRPSTIQNIESGRVTRPSTLPHIADALGVEISVLEAGGPVVAPAATGDAIEEYEKDLLDRIAALEFDAANVQTRYESNRRIIVRSLLQEKERLEDELRAFRDAKSRARTVIDANRE